MDSLNKVIKILFGNSIYWKMLMDDTALDFFLENSY